MKGRYGTSGTILDAGAGPGATCTGSRGRVSISTAPISTPRVVDGLRRNYPDVSADHFQVAPVQALPFADGFFDHVICCAVLHFAEDEADLGRMFGELIRVLKPGGSLFTRVATDVGLADRMLPLGHGRFTMPDGTDRFLLTRPVLQKLLDQHHVRLLEPFKAVLVDELREHDGAGLRQAAGLIQQERTPGGRPTAGAIHPAPCSLPFSRESGEPWASWTPFKPPKTWEPARTRANGVPRPPPRRGVRRAP